jgi:hypothetical protein
VKKKRKEDKNQLELFGQLPPQPVKPGEHFLVDGSNVMGVRGKSQPPSLKTLLHLLIELKENSHDFTCIIDANARFTLLRFAGQPDQEVYIRFLEKYSSRFTESTGGMRADDLLLQRADRLRQRIISNDRFSAYVNKYTWLRNPDARLIKFQMVNKDLQIPALEIIVSCDGELKTLISKLESLLT